MHSFTFVVSGNNLEELQQAADARVGQLDGTGAWEYTMEIADGRYVHLGPKWHVNPDVKFEFSAQVTATRIERYGVR